MHVGLKSLSVVVLFRRGVCAFECEKMTDRTDGQAHKCCPRCLRSQHVHSTVPHSPALPPPVLVEQVDEDVPDLPDDDLFVPSPGLPEPEGPPTVFAPLQTDWEARAYQAWEDFFFRR